MHTGNTCLSEYAACVGHKGRNHVHQMREAPHIYAIRVAEQRVDEAAHEQRVLQVVDLFEQLRGLSAAAVGGIPAARAVSHVPLVKRQPQPFARSFQSLHVVAHRRGLMNVAIHIAVG